MEFLINEFDKIGLISDKIEEIRNKDGIYLYRVRCKTNTFVLKYFDKTQDPREPEYYTLLARAGVPTLAVIGMTDRAIAMEDLNISPRWRLSAEEDLKDPVTARNLAQWYRTLHDASGLILPNKENWYSEYGLLTEEKLRKAAHRLGISAIETWDFIIEHLDHIIGFIEKMDPVVNYNDFYYTNLAVGRNGREAIMFDYNFMGKGYRAAGLRNVCASMRQKAAAAFLESYGPIAEYEYRVDDVVSTLTTLVMAAKRETLPWWAEEAVQSVRSGKLKQQICDLISV